MTQIVLRGNDADSQARAIVKARDEPDRAGSPAANTVTAQLTNEGNGLCVEGRYSGAQILANDAVQIKAKAP